VPISTIVPQLSTWLLCVRCIADINYLANYSDQSSCWTDDAKEHLALLETFAVFLCINKLYKVLAYCTEVI